jgi:hypothetical protein
MKITYGELMNIRVHHGYGPDLRPGETSDIICPSCNRENAEDRENAESEKENENAT